MRPCFKKLSRFFGRIFMATVSPVAASTASMTLPKEPWPTARTTRYRPPSSIWSPSPIVYSLCNLPPSWGAWAACALVLATGRLSAMAHIIAMSTVMAISGLFRRVTEHPFRGRGSGAARRPASRADLGRGAWKKPPRPPSLRWWWRHREPPSPGAQDCWVWCRAGGPWRE
ncbi:MAG: hypothetical protein BJ554DRAFT_278 [Olpidium bornovanus]|uniref:Secreted protein n=1 Tax=Olpidium bornovanus TaxID=278681 RepID=A0A8H7ZU58_9FUNG|nr:MAG: hypothetical protein BJ554DRAFT_278 [Olpidium bornovanus]